MRPKKCSSRFLESLSQCLEWVFENCEKSIWKWGEKNGLRSSYDLLEYGVEYLSETNPSFPLYVVMMSCWWWWLLWHGWLKKRVLSLICDKVFKNGSSEICRRQPLKDDSLQMEDSNILKAVLRKFYLVHSWILWLICYWNYCQKVSSSQISGIQGGIQICPESAFMLLMNELV